MSRLADAGYEPAKALFVEGLDDPDWSWRLDCLTNLGFHYSLAPDGELMDKVRQMLLTDPSEMIRLSAPFVLANQSTWGDPALLAALQADPEPVVRRSVFDALLRMAGLSFAQSEQQIERIDRGEIEPTWEELQRVLAAAGLNPGAPT
jgi:HEAT repeat protein